MKRIATITDWHGNVTGLVHGTDEIGKHITVNGRKWNFDFDEFFGPHWMKADGITERKCQNPKKEVCDAFGTWQERRRKRLGLPKPTRTLKLT